MDKTIVIIFPLALVLLGGAWFMWGRQAPPTTAISTPQSQSDKYSYNQDGGQTGQQGIAVGEPYSSNNQPIPTNTNQVQNFMQATLHTNKGDIVIEFMSADAPNTVQNFAKLAQASFYNGTKFHRVIAGFMIQGGDPLSADDSKEAMWGTGGPGYKFADEIHSNNRNNIGTISMANAGPNTNGSQFFINVANNNFLDTKHTVFGKVTAGMEVVNTIAASQTGQNDRPIEPIIITSVEVK